MVGMTRARTVLALAVLGLIPVVAGGPARPAAADAVQVQMVDQGSSHAFMPGQISVPAGTTITWVNRSSAPHTATDPGVFDTGNIPVGAQASVTLKNPGTYQYVCLYHPGMNGTITVTQVENATPISPPPPPPAPATAAPTVAPPPTSTPTATPTPVLTLSLKVSPKLIHPGGTLHIQAKTLPGASLIIKVSYSGAKSVTRRARSGNGSYSTKLRISKQARRGTLTVRGTAAMGNRRVQKTANAQIHPQMRCAGKC